MADISSTYRILGVDALTGPATKAEAALGRLELTADEAARDMESLVDAGKSLAAAIKAAAEKAERGPRRKKQGKR